MQAVSALLGFNRTVYQPHRTDSLQNLQARYDSLPELRHCPEYGSPVLFLMRRAAWYSL